jgi:hypothetical protein
MDLKPLPYLEGTRRQTYILYENGNYSRVHYKRGKRTGQVN